MNLTITQLLLLNAAALIMIGIFGVITRRNIIKVLLSINIFQTGVNLLLIGLGYIEGGEVPIITEGIKKIVPFVDPLPQALVLTSIVIGFGTTALGLTVAITLSLQLDLC